MTDEEEKSRRAIVPSVGNEPTKPWSGLIRRGLLEISRLVERAIAPLAEGSRVLVCDDEEAIVEVIATMLETAGYKVRSTLNSLEAIEIAREFQPHVAFIGEIMPRMDGIKLALELTRFLPRSKMVLTAEAELSDLELFRANGWPFDILVCPFEKEDLLEKTRSWVHEAMHPEHPRIMVVSTEEAINEVVPDLLNRNGCIAIATGTKRKDGWPVYEIIEEVKTFQPDIVFLLHNLHLWPRMTGVDLAILLLENFPDKLFLVGRFADDQFTVSEEALAYARSHGCHCETVNIPFETDELLTKVRAWSTNHQAS